MARSIHERILFGERLRAFRHKAGLRLVDAAQITGINYNRLGRAERGESDLKFDDILSLASGYGVSVAKLVGDESLEDALNRQPELPTMTPEELELVQKFRNASIAQREVVRLTLDQLGPIEPDPDIRIQHAPRRGRKRRDTMVLTKYKKIKGEEAAEIQAQEEQSEFEKWSAPAIARAAAGYDFTALDDHAKGSGMYRVYPPKLCRVSQHAIAFEVVGDSMRSTLRPGDVVFVEPDMSKPVRKGDLVVAIIAPEDGDETRCEVTIKRWERKGAVVLLHADNPTVLERKLPRKQVLKYWRVVCHVEEDRVQRELDI